MDRATLGHNLKPLQRGGLVQVESGEDRRARLVVLTERGRSKADEGKQLWARAQRRFENKLGAGDAESLRQDLSRVSRTSFDD